MFAANLHFNALRQGKDVPIARGTRGTHVRTRGTAAIGALVSAGSPRGSVCTGSSLELESCAVLETFLQCYSISSSLQK